MQSAGQMTRAGRWLVLLPLGAWAVMAAVGYLPTKSLGGRPGVEGMIVGQAVVLAVVYATLLPAVRRMVGLDAPGRLRLGLKAGAIRLIVTLSVITVIACVGGVAPVSFLVWVAIAYVVIIQVETLALVYWNKPPENEP